MAGAKGYSSYRGRASKLKIFLAALLVLVIAAACLVIFLQRNVFYDANGQPYMRFPWQQEEEQQPPPHEDETGNHDSDGVELIVQEPPAPPTTVTLSVAAAPLTVEDWNAWTAGTQNPDCTATALTLKDAAGKIYYNSSKAISGAVQAKGDTADALVRFTADENLAVMARFSCLHDARAANSNVRGMGLRNTGGYIFYDGNNSQWLDPSKPAAREYLCGLVAEVAALGVDEILLTDLSYPTVGKINKINYNGDGPIEENLAQLVRDIRTALEPYNITLSLELPDAVILQDYDEVSGQKLSLLAPLVDRIYAVTTADQVEALTEKVTTASESTAFVPELPYGTNYEDLTGHLLILPADE